MRRAAVLLLAAAALAAGPSPAPEPLSFGRFGVVKIYGKPSASHVVLFVSGDGGWNSGVVDMAGDLAGMDALVAGIDIRTYLKDLEASHGTCSDLAADFEALSQFIQKKLDLPRYIPPVLAGYSSGATLVYATLVQAPTGTFHGALSLGFCPDLAVRKPLCRGRGLSWKTGPGGKAVLLEPSADLEAPWIALQGTVDQVCDPEETRAFVSRVPAARVVMLPKVGHGYSAPKNWTPQLADAFAQLTAESRKPPPVKEHEGAALDDLPLVEVPAAHEAGDLLAVIVSGDGGWAGLDKEVSRILASRGVPVVGLNSLQYFWSRRTPEGSAKDLERILRHYLEAWHGRRLLLIGYSRGADVLPFMVSRLPADLLSRVSLVALLGPAHSVDFQIHLTDYLGGSHSKTALDVLPEVKKLAGVRVACFYGESESDTICPEMEPGTAKPIRLPGGHHFGGDYAFIANKLLEESRELP